MLHIEGLIAFVSVIDNGSFSAAADRLGQTPSGISRAISRLEAQLGTTLITRTTRRLDLTEEGSWLLPRAQSILAQLQETEEHMHARQSHPSGLVRVSAATPALIHLLAPLMAAFMDAYPLVRLELVSGETIVDLIEARIDLAIRIGPLADSTLNARRLGTSRLRILASPDYLARHGTPQNQQQLGAHRLLGFTAPATLNIWPLPQPGGDGLAVQPVIAASSGETVRQLALDGAGIACLADFLTHGDVAGGRLVPVLETATLPWSQPVWAVFYKQGALAPRIAALVEFLARGLKGVLKD
jgi:DNA-binding transcriptional LysR family regulator